MSDVTRKRLEDLVVDLAEAQATADRLREQMEQAAVAHRAEGATFEELGRIVGMSGAGIFKMMKRHDLATAGR